MNDLNKRTPKKPDIPEEIQATWQRIVDLMARILNVTAAAITKADPPQLEVFLTSTGERNPFRKGERSKLEAGLYCERVIRERVPLLIPDALKDPEWGQSPMIRMGMTYYLGFPLLWSDGEVFGSMCIFDKKDNPQATQFQEWVSQIRQLIEKDLCTLVEISEREGLLAELQRHRDHLQKMVAERTSELERNKEKLEERLRFEDLISDLPANFVDLPPDVVHVEIALALKKICVFFGTDHCGLLEALTDLKRIDSVNIYHKEGMQRTPINVLASRHPWAYHRLVEEKESVIFSSLEALPPEANVDRAHWEKQGVQAMLMLPVVLGGQVTHLIGLWSDRCSREWPLAYIHRLSFLGEILAKGLLHMRTDRALLRSEQVLAEAQRIAHLGSWDWDIRGGTHHWSDEFYRIFGLLPQEIEATYEAFLASVHPDDRQAVHQANQESISDPDKPYSIEYRVVRPDGTERVVEARADILFDQDRRSLRMIGTLYDITERKHAQEELEKAFDEIKKLKEQLEAENIYLREEMELKEGFKDIIGVSNLPYRWHRGRIGDVVD